MQSGYQKYGEVMSEFQDEIKRCIDVLREGGLILYPTDTIWGIGCDATNPDAVKRVYELKKRDDSKALIVLLDDAGKLNRYVREVPEVAWDLIDNSDRPITIIYSGVLNLAKNLMASDGTAAIRITSDEFCKQLIYKFGKPLVSTSANISGEPFGGRFQDVSSDILNGVDHTVDLHKNRPVGPPSSIIKLDPSGKFEIIRR
jgi:L-threonylcarbamoyladenylate synthase